MFKLKFNFKRVSDKFSFKNIKFTSNSNKNSTESIPIIQPNLEVKKVGVNSKLVLDSIKQEYMPSVFVATYYKGKISDKQIKYNNFIKKKFEGIFNEEEIQYYDLILKSYKDMMTHPVLCIEGDKHIDILVRTRQSAQYSYCNNEGKLKLVMPLKLNENFKYHVSPIVYRYIKQNNESLYNTDLLFQIKNFKFTQNKYELEDEFVKLWGIYFKGISSILKNNDHILLNKYVNKYNTLYYMLDEAHLKFLKCEISKETFERFKNWVETQEGIKINKEEIIKLKFYE